MSARIIDCASCSGARESAVGSKSMSPRRARQLDNTVLYLITYVPLLFLVVVVCVVTG